jgi:hypothetical protein
MTRLHVQKVIDWCADQIHDPSQSWFRRCMQMSRTAWLQPSWGYSAKIAYYKIPAKHRHYTLAKNVPAGAVCFGLLHTTYGHAWIAGRGAPDARVGFSVDYRRRGQIDRAPLSLPAWTNDSKVRWTDWSPFGMLPLWDDEWNRKNIPRPRH